MVSSPPLALTTRFSDVPMSRKNGAGVDAIEADAGAVGGDGEDLGAVAAVDLDGVDAGAALVEVAAVAGVPDHPVVARLAEDLVVAVAAGEDVVAGAAEEQVGAALAQQGVVARLRRRAWSLPLPAGERVVAGAAEQLRLRQGAVGLVEGDGVVAALAEDLDQAVLATVGVPPRIATAPPLTRIVPAASRLTVMVLSMASPMMLSMPAAGMKVAVTAGTARSLQQFEAEAAGRTVRPVSAGPEEISRRGFEHARILQ